MNRRSLYSAPEAELILVRVEENFLDSPFTPTNRTGESFNDQTVSDCEDDWL